jgi:hypothetical protein
MKYMPILPIGMYGIYEQSESHNAFILPQFWIHYDYRQGHTIRKWNVVIIDNAMYEQPDAIPFNKLIDLASELTAKRIFIVAPEHFTNPNETINLAVQTACEYGTKGNNWEMMVIVHGGAPAELIYQMNTLYANNIKAFGIAVSYWRGGESRAALLAEQRKPDCYYHAMGLDDIDELLGLRKACFDSVDTSMAATAAVNAIDLQVVRKIVRTGPRAQPRRVNLMQESFEQGVHRGALRNVLLIKQLCEG